MKLPFNVDLKDKVVAITGGGGVLMSAFGEALAACGAKVALLDINGEAVEKVAASIGENALAVKTDCLDKNDIIRAKEKINAKWGKVNFLINGAGGNNPKATCDNETMTPDLTGVKDFFALDESGLKFVFDLNITSAFLVTQVFAADMVKTGGNIINVSSMNAYQNSCVQCGKSGNIQLYSVACGTFRAVQHSLQRHSSRLFRDQPEPRAVVQ